LNHERYTKSQELIDRPFDPLKAIRPNRPRSAGIEFIRGMRPNWSGMLTYSNKAIADYVFFGHDFDRINKIGRANLSAKTQASSDQYRIEHHPTSTGYRVPHSSSSTPNWEVRL
jgi:hypothetical protein